MTITEEQKRERLKYIGSSDAAAMLGLSKYRSKKDIWYERVFPQEVDQRVVAEFGKQDPRDVGNELEPILVAKAERHLGVRLLPHQMVVGPNGIMAANIDAIAAGTSPTIAVEAKSTTKRELWGEPGSQAVPDSVAMQCQHIMYCVPTLQIVHVPVCFVTYGHDYEMYQVTRDELIIETLRQECEAFWKDNVLKKVAPDEEILDPDVLRRVLRQKGRRTVMDHSLFSMRENAKAALRTAIEEDAYYKHQIISMLGDCEIGEMPRIKKEVTYFESSREIYGRGLQFHDDLCEKCGVGTKTTSFRTLRYRKMNDAGSSV